MEVKVTKDMRGDNRAENDFEMGNDRVLRISTHKVFGGNLVTTASVHTRIGTAMRHIISYGVDDGTADYHKRLASNKVRCTAKTIAEQQMDALRQLDTLKAEAHAHYAAQVARAPA